MAEHLLSLIQKIEAAAAPDRDLDVAIVRALYPDIGRHAPHCSGEEPIFWEDPYRKQPAPRFTASIDVALSIVPEHFALEGLSIWEGQPSAATVLGTHLHKGEYWHGSPDGRWKGDAATPALAVCAAALRARAALASAQRVEVE